MHYTFNIPPSRLDVDHVIRVTRASWLKIWIILCFLCFIPRYKPPFIVLCPRYNYTITYIIPIYACDSKHVTLCVRTAGPIVLPIYQYRELFRIVFVPWGIITLYNNMYLSWCNIYNDGFLRIEYYIIFVLD